MSMELYFTIIITTIILVSIFSIIVSNKILKQEIDDKIKLDISVTQMRASEKRIKDFLKEHDLNNNVSIKEIAEVLKISEGNEDSSIKLEQAILSEPDPTGWRKVTFKKGLSRAEKNFAFTHECAHIINKDKPPLTRPDRCNKSPCEQLADYTAAALLMPKSKIEIILKENNYDLLNKNKRLKIIEKICKQFNVTEVIAIRRINEIKELNSI